MNERSKTPARIVDSARRLFNEKGYSATALAEIAADLGISQGNLTYHFRTKRDIVHQLEILVEDTMRNRWRRQEEGEIAEDYVEHLAFAMRMTWDIRFMLRDYAQFSDDPNWLRSNPYLLADYDELRSLLGRLKREGSFRADVKTDFDVIARTLWMTSRYWMDHLRELEGKEQFEWDDLERGVLHHFALLSHFLKPTARDKLSTAIQGTLRVMKRIDPQANAGTIRFS